MAKKKRTNKKRGRKKTILILVAVILTAITVSVLAFTTPVSRLFRGEPEPQKAARAFMKTVQDGDSASSYAAASSAFQNAATDEDFAIFLERYPLLTRHEEWSVNNVSIRGDEATVTGTITAGEESSPIVISLTREDGVWRILNINLNAQASSGQ